MEDELSIRQCQPADRKRILELHRGPMKSVDAFADTEGELETDLEDIESAYIGSGGDFLVGELAGMIVAMGAYKPPSEYFTTFLGDLDEGTAEITRMRVDSEHQRRGFGGELYDELERRARADSVSELVLDTTQRQKAAQGLYETKGFREIERRAIEFAGDDFVMMFYKKVL